MQFGVMIQPKIDDWQIVREAEELGYDTAWVPDSQMLWSDCYATLALAAVHTARIRIGTGVAIAGTRIAPVTAHSIATINKLAPGRTFLGIGTGHTAMRVMGQDPVPVKEFRDYIRVVRALLRGEEVDYTYRGRTRSIQFLHQDLGFLDLEQPIPIYVAANGPRAVRTAGAYGDGLMSLFNEQTETLKRNLALAREGAEQAGRRLDDFHTAAVTDAVLLQPGEDLTSDRVVDRAGSWVMCSVHFLWEIWHYTKDDSVIPPHFANIWDEYCAHVDRMETPPEKRYRQIHDGHCTYLVPEERHFVTPEAIRGTCLVGEPAEIAAHLRSAAALGLREVALLPPMAHFREVMTDFAKEVIPLL
jgi:alkanesulfonate monooxygenase SsuD/methylene tetrahydromethanopterin reductase-like flavin-dependent oxidoreductase (luciferase family)